MNSIRKHRDLGQFVLYDSNGEPCIQLGDSIDVCLRTFNKRCFSYLEWTVEIVRSTFHNCEPVSSTNLAKLHILPFSNDTDKEIAGIVFQDSAFGQVHRLGLFRGMLTINGLLWDQKILHVRDIAT